MADVAQAVVDNPVTVVAAVGAVVAVFAKVFGVDAETQLVIVQGILGAALLVRLAVAAAKHQSP